MPTSMPALRTSVVAFDTAVADLTPLLHDPVDVLFGVQLGGGTDIAQAIAKQFVAACALVAIDDGALLNPHTIGKVCDQRPALAPSPSANLT